MTDLTASRYPLGAVTAGSLRVRRGLGDTTISTSTRGTDLFEARSQRCAPAIDVRAGTVTLKFPLICPRLTDRAHELILHGRIPWSIEIDGGAKNIAADFTESDLRALDVDGGLSGVVLDLGRPTGMVPDPVRRGAQCDPAPPRRGPGPSPCFRSRVEADAGPARGRSGRRADELEQPRLRRGRRLL